MKMLRLITCLSVVLLLAVSANAQKNHAKEANNAFNNEAYFNAIDLYKKAYSVTNKASDKARIIFQIAECYRLMTNASQAEVWYGKAVKAKYPDPIAVLHLADQMKLQAKYAEALKEYKKYQEKVPGDKRGEDGAKSCELAQEWRDNPTRYEVNMEILLNTAQYDFSPTFADKRNNQLIFTSSREGSTGSGIDERTGENFQDLYTSTRDKKGKWSEPTVLGAPVNTEHNEGSACLNKKRSEIFYTLCMNEKNKNLGCKIMTAKKAGKGYGEPTMVIGGADYGDTTNFGHPSVSDDGTTLFFASDMDGGKGGKDIWYIKYDKKAKTWGQPINVESINTAGNELFPYIHKNGNLYFSSDMHIGMGGLDIFMAEKSGEDQWGNVQNMKSPINSEADDYGIIFDGDEDRGFFTSNRSGGKGNDDILNFRMPPMLFALQCAVYDKDTKAPVPGARIKVIGTDNTSYEINTDENGGFNFEENGDDRYIKGEVTYSIQVDKQDYLVAKDQITTVGLEESTTFIKEFYIQYTSPDVAIEFPEVRYALDKWELQVNEEVNSPDSLDYLFKTLTDNPTIVIELQAHTDSRGSASYNQRLSQKRAQSCVDYLVSKGIPSERMVPKGYGESKVRITDAEIKKLKTKQEQEAAHQKNRRTEFAVLNFDYVPKAEGGSDGSSDAGGE